MVLASGYGRSAMAMRRLQLPTLLLAAAATSGCGDTRDTVSLELPVDDDGTLVQVYVSSSAAGAEIEVDWQARVEARGQVAPDCSVAVYRWLAPMPDFDAELPLPSVADPEAWPTSWEGGELVARERVATGEVVEFGARFDEPSEREVAGVLGFATCPEAELALELDIEAAIQLGPRAAFELFAVEAWRLR